MAELHEIMFALEAHEAAKRLRQAGQDCSWWVEIVSCLAALAMLALLVWLLWLVLAKLA